MNPSNVDTLQQMLLQLRLAFLEEMPEKLDRLENILLEIEKNGADKEIYNEFYRTVHSLKGSGGTHGLHILTTICHQLEDLLNTTQGGEKFPPALANTSLAYVDLLRIAAEKLKSGSDNFLQIEEKLIALRNQLTQKKYAVLVVDNSKLLTQIFLQALSGLPVQPVVMADGMQALMRALTEPFNLLITTNEIPVLSGISLIGAIKLSNSKNAHIKTILITSNKKVTGHINRTTDSNYIIFKDAKLADNLVELTKSALAIK